MPIDENVQQMLDALKKLQESQPQVPAYPGRYFGDSHGACPSCGRCPQCGRGGYGAGPWNLQPEIVWC